MNISFTKTIADLGHEQLLFCHDASCGLHALIAIHSTTLGPAVGGTRCWPYENEEQAIIDVLRLSRGMTYKNALAGLPFGGGKAVILENHQTQQREKTFRSLGRFVQQLNGRFITAEDVGTSTADMEFLRLETAYVAGLAGRSGDPSPWTALGVFHALRAAAKHRWRSENFAGKIAALQGCGNVGYHLAQKLHHAGVALIVTDVNRARVQRLVHEFGAQAVAPDEIFRVPADFFAPCALGGMLNDQTIPQLQAQIIVGAANNQLLEPHHGDRLRERNITYVPDYVANAGGVINGCREMLGWEPERSSQRIQGIYDTTLAILQMAESEGIATNHAADRLAEKRLRQSDAGVTNW